MGNLKVYFNIIIFSASALLVATAYNACGSNFELTHKADISSYTGDNDEGGNLNLGIPDNTNSKKDPYIPADHVNNPNGGRALWVSKSGSNSNDCSSESSSCKTIQKGVSVLSPGDTLNIKEGVYQDDGGNSSYKKPGVWCGWHSPGPTSSNVCINGSGTKDKPITIQAAPGHVGKVIIDAQLKRLGIHVMYQDYIHIKYLNVINAATIGIASGYSNGNDKTMNSDVSVGVIVEGNVVDKVIKYNDLDNISGIGPWRSKDWIIRNNVINDVGNDSSGKDADGYGIQAYRASNILVEHNTMTNIKRHGVYWKSQFQTASGQPVAGSEIRYNYMDVGAHALLINTADVVPGKHYFHHNIARSHGYGEDGAIHMVVSRADFMPKGLRIEHNVFDGINNPDKHLGVYNDGYQDTTFIGNIFVNFGITYFMVNRGGTSYPIISHSDYNIFSEAPYKSMLDTYSGKGWIKVIESLSDWQQTKKSFSVTLDQDNPDSNSFSAPRNNLFNNADNSDYTYKANSKAMGLMSDGSNAGPYQFGNEVIGITYNK